MNRIDEIYTKYPFYGSRRIKDELEEYDICICREHVQRLMRLMGLEAIYPKPNTSKAHPEHQKYPYLLRNITASYPNHIWGTDITYVRLESGFAYLVAYLDWYSRYVIAWELSLSMETEFCIMALNRAMEMATPCIHNSDQGVQFTDREYIGILDSSGIQISMDGRGRCMDNIFTERLWRTVKYENIYLKSYATIKEAHAGLTEYFEFYNKKRRHQSLGRRTPEDVYFEDKK
jgi:putative transposase